MLLPIKFLQVVIGRTRPRHKSGTVIAQIRSPRAAIERRRRGAAVVSGAISGYVAPIEAGGTVYAERGGKKGVIALLAAASVVGALGGCVACVPGPPVVVAPQGGPGNGFCPPGQAKKGNC
ncbi:hypothetical protein BLAT2472_40116 [Burkholderia latens]